MLVFGGARTIGELAAAEQVRAPTMTRIVRGLEEEGLIEREADPHDGRRVLVRATAKGKRVLWRGRERRVERLAELLGRLSAEDVARIHAAAELVESALAQEPREPAVLEHAAAGLALGAVVDRVLLEVDRAIGVPQT